MKSSLRLLRKSRRIMCELCKLEEMDYEVVKFLSEHGNFPALKEDEDDFVKGYYEDLYKKLFRLQVGMESEFIQALRELGYAPSTIMEIEKLIQMVLEERFLDMNEEIADTGIEVAIVAREQTIQQIIVQGMLVQAVGYSDNVLEDLRNRIYTFSADTFKRIKGDFAGTLARGFEEGLGIDEIATQLRDDFSNLRDHRLKLIARVEVQGAQNMGNHQTMLDFGVQYKQWVSVGDNRVRGRRKGDKADHIYLHGQVVRMDEAFSNGLQYPLDRSGGRATIHEWINCRCRSVPYIPRRGEVIVTTPYYP